MRKIVFEFLTITLLLTVVLLLFSFPQFVYGESEHSTTVVIHKRNINPNVDSAKTTDELLKATEGVNGVSFILFDVTNYYQSNRHLTEEAIRKNLAGLTENQLTTLGAEVVAEKSTSRDVSGEDGTLSFEVPSVTDGNVKAYLIFEKTSGEYVGVNIFFILTEGTNGAILHFYPKTVISKPKEPAEPKAPPEKKLPPTKKEISYLPQLNEKSKISLLILGIMLCMFGGLMVKNKIKNNK